MRTRQLSVVRPTELGVFLPDEKGAVSHREEVRSET